MDWSYNLLSEAERALLRRLAVFSGGWNLEATEEVANFGELSKEHILDLLTQLHDKSLVVVKERGRVARYGLLETVRQYGYGKLSDEGESEEVCQRHATYQAVVKVLTSVGIGEKSSIEPKNKAFPGDA